MTSIYVQFFTQASYVFPVSFCSHFMMEDASELAAMQTAERLIIDPAITVVDLERSLENYMEMVGYRNIQEILDAIVEGKCTWRTAPKAEGVEI